MIKFSKFSESLLVSTSVLSFLCVASVQAQNTSLEDYSTMSYVGYKLGSTAKTLWTHSPDLGVTSAITKQAKAFVKGTAEDFLDTAASDIARAAQSKVHSLMYRDASVKVVDKEGNHIGYVETVAPRLIRNILKNQLGIDVEQSIPGVPAFVMKVIGNYAENQLAAVLEEKVFDGVKQVATRATLVAVGKAMGIAEDKIQKIMEAHLPSSASLEEVDSSLAIDKEKVKKELTSQIAEGIEDTNEQEAYGNIGADLVKNLTARLKISVNDWIQTSVNDVAQEYARKLITTTAESALRFGEVGVTTGAATVTGLLTGGTAVPALVAAGVAGDNYLATGAHKDSFLRRGLKWFVDYDSIVSKLTSRANQVVGTSVNINKLLRQFTLTKNLALTSKDYTQAYGTFDRRDTEEGFVEIYQTKKPVNFTTLFENARDRLAEAKKRVIDAAKGVKKEVVHVTTAFAEAADRFAIELNPMLADDFWNDEPTTQLTSQKTPSSKSWYQFWK